MGSATLPISLHVMMALTLTHSYVYTMAILVRSAAIPLLITQSYRSIC
jgi:hypothetical protein